MRPLLILILSLFIAVNASATAQASDKIVYNGKIYFLNSNPLEDYFEKNPDQRPKSGIISTGLWRGYIATFEVIDSILYLKDIEVRYTPAMSKEGHEWRSVLKEVFPGDNKIIIDWFTGLLVIPHGDIVNYIHMGYASTYEKYILLEVDNGKVKQERKYKHKQYEKFKSRQFQEFKKTEKYKEMKSELQKRGTNDKFIESFLRDYVIEYTTRLLTE